MSSSAGAGNVTDKSSRSGRLWKSLAVASLLVPLFEFAVVGPVSKWLGGPYLWTWATLPVAGGLGGVLAFAAILGLIGRKLGVWPLLCSGLGLLASAYLMFIGAMALPVVAFFGPVHVRPSYVTVHAGLADIPAAAFDIEALRQNGQGDRWYFLKFTAPAEDIQTFVGESPSIVQPPYAVFNADNIYAPYRLSEDERLDRMGDDLRYLAYLNEIPWFHPDIDVKGRLFDFETEGQWGTVVIDDDKGEVYVFLAWK